MRTRAAFLALAVAVLIPATATADLLNGSYRFGYSMGTSRAFAPPTAAGQMIGSITYHEFGGVLGKLIILFGAAPQKPAPTVRIVSSKTWCGVSHCYTTTEYEVTHPSKEDWDRYDEEVKRFAPIARDVIQNGVPIDIYIDLAGTTGDASGGSFTMMFRGQFVGLLGFPAVWLQGGLGFGGYTFDSLERQRVSLDGDLLRNETVTESHSYRYAGFPFRTTIFPYRHVGAYVQFDLNMFALPLFDDDDRSPSLTRFGLELRLDPLFLRGEAAASAFDPGSVSVFGEVGLEL